MANLNFSQNEEIVVLRKYNLNPTELFTLRLLLIAQDDEEDTNLYDFLSLGDDCTTGFRNCLESLQEKGIILKSYKIPESGSTISVYDIPINKTVTKGLYKSAFEMGVELFEHYPQWGMINGRAIALRSVAKKFNSLEDAYRFYGKSIGWNIEKHKEIIELLDWAKDKEIINFSLSTFLINNGWLDLQSMKEGKVSNVGFDSYTDI